MENTEGDTTSWNINWLNVFLYPKNGIQNLLRIGNRFEREEKAEKWKIRKPLRKYSMKLQFMLKSIMAEVESEKLECNKCLKISI